jgi:hypothetical protein
MLLLFLQAVGQAMAGQPVTSAGLGFGCVAALHLTSQHAAVAHLEQPPSLLLNDTRRHVQRILARFGSCCANTAHAAAAAAFVSGCKPGYGGPACDKCWVGFWSHGGPATNLTTCCSCPLGTTTLTTAT